MIVSPWIPTMGVLAEKWMAETCAFAALVILLPSIFLSHFFDETESGPTATAAAGQFWSVGKPSYRLDSPIESQPGMPDVDEQNQSGSLGVKRGVTVTTPLAPVESAFGCCGGGLMSGVRLPRIIGRQGRSQSGAAAPGRKQREIAALHVTTDIGDA
jgi:hypothetical protein